MKKDIFPTNQLPLLKEKKIQEPELEPDRKYKCEKCARTYKNKPSLVTHKKFDCDVVPQFRCKLCDKRFKRKFHMNAHVNRVHHNTNSNKSELRHECNMCSRSYTLLRNLNRHKYVEHSEVKTRFICDYCGYKANWKSHLSTHITASHLKTSKPRYNCNKCSRSYASPNGLSRHKSLAHVLVEPHFICDFCGFKTISKSSLSRHIIASHLMTSKTRHHCNECSKSYVWLSALNQHKRLAHSECKPNFFCHYCEHKTNLKSSLLRHITLRHLKYCDDTLEIKDEIIFDGKSRSGLSEDQEVHHSLHFKNNKKDLTCVIEYSSDDTMTIKDEIIFDDRETTIRTCNERYEPKLCVYIKKDIFPTNQLPIRKEKKIQESELESYKKYKCEKCARTYKKKQSLVTHKKFECDVVPQFGCKLCDKRFKRKFHVNAHVNRVHHNANSNKSELRHKCNMCPRSYTLLRNLSQHKHVEHAAVKTRFICDYCGYKTKWKSHLSTHITVSHLKTSKPRHNCNKCSRSYASVHEKLRSALPEDQAVYQNLLFKKKEEDFNCVVEYGIDDTLEIKEEIIDDPETAIRKCTEKYEPRLRVYIRNDIFPINELPIRKEKKIQESQLELDRKYKCDKCARVYKKKYSLVAHKKFECDVVPQFGCKLCDKRFKRKFHMNAHVNRVHHNANSNKSKLRHKCNMCPRSYTLLRNLSQHKHVEHAAVVKKFNCDCCGFKTNLKSSLSRHIIASHLMTSKTRHHCNECSKSYVWLSALNQHKRLVHSEFKPNFFCHYCEHKTNQKSSLLRHIALRHLKQ
ncbi:zinc finger protein 208-like [Belonocnema kinseyi]|uniref:zinc finger protein 208-like n=1 Tax=Belonocnema kinseyi TaxID=2817044 RepID=UPI00143DE9F1|nr:zinc finger protein 208-like [Belonocnema kinseyi]